MKSSPTLTCDEPVPAEIWLPNMDLNHDKQIQSLLCYRYTIRQNQWPYPSDSPPGVKRSAK